MVAHIYQELKQERPKFEVSLSKSLMRLCFKIKNGKGHNSVLECPESDLPCCKKLFKEKQKKQVTGPSHIQREGAIHRGENTGR